MGQRGGLFPYYELPGEIERFQLGPMGMVHLSLAERSIRFVTHKPSSRRSRGAIQNNTSGLYQLRK